MPSGFTVFPQARSSTSLVCLSKVHPSFEDHSQYCLQLEASLDDKIKLFSRLRPKNTFKFLLFHFYSIISFGYLYTCIVTSTGLERTGSMNNILYSLRITQYNPEVPHSRCAIHAYMVRLNE